MKFVHDSKLEGIHKTEEKEVEDIEDIEMGWNVIV